MILLIILISLVLLLIMPLGLDAAYTGGNDSWEKKVTLRIKTGPMSLTLYPRTRREQGRKRKPTAKNNKEKPKTEPRRRRRFRPGLHNYRKLLSIALKSSLRIRRHICVDLIRLRYVAGGDPLDAIRHYGTANALLSCVSSLAHNLLLIRDEELVVDVDVTAERSKFEARLVLTSQVWEILYIGGRAGITFLRWYWQLWKNSRERNDVSDGMPAEQKG